MRSKQVLKLKINFEFITFTSRENLIVPSVSLLKGRKVHCNAKKGVILFFSYQNVDKIEMFEVRWI